MSQKKSLEAEGRPRWWAANDSETMANSEWSWGRWSSDLERSEAASKKMRRWYGRGIVTEVRKREMRRSSRWITPDGVFDRRDSSSATRSSSEEVETPTAPEAERARSRRKEREKTADLEAIFLPVVS